MGYWQKHIRLWCGRRSPSEPGSNPTIVERILIRKGWKPDKYRPEMKKELFNYLNKWYKLSEKKMPSIPTRRNPVVVLDEIFDLEKAYARTMLSNGWIVDSRINNGGYISIAFNQNLKKETEPDFAENLIEFTLNHQDLVDDMLRS